MFFPSQGKGSGPSTPTTRQAPPLPSTGPPPQPPPSVSPPAAKSPPPKQQQTSQGPGLFRGILNKLPFQSKNQMILPDDKDPTVGDSFDVTVRAA